jgi:hypothetical protein
MKKTLCGLVVAAFGLAAVVPASAAIAPRMAGETSIVQIQDAPKPAKTKKTAKKKAPAKKQVAKKSAKKPAPKTA